MIVKPTVKTFRRDGKEYLQIGEGPEIELDPETLSDIAEYLASHATPIPNQRSNSGKRPRWHLK